MNADEFVDVETVAPKTTRVQVRSHAFFVDKPVDKGGSDKGPMASEYFLASLASCHITTAHKIAEKRAANLEAVHVRAGAWFDGDLIQRIHLDIYVRGSVDDEERDTIFRLTERICTISRATSVPIERAFYRWSQRPT